MRNEGTVDSPFEVPLSRATLTLEVRENGWDRCGAIIGVGKAGDLAVEVSIDPYDWPRDEATGEFVKSVFVRLV